MPTTTTDKAIEAAEHPNLLETAAQLAAAEGEWRQSAVLGIDTEFVRERTYRAGLGLVQVSDGHKAWLWDAVRCPDSEPVRAMLQDPAIVKVLHSGSEDVEVLLHSLDVTPQPLVDTQIACALLGQPLQLSYQAAAKWLLDVDIDKEHTRSNWLRRPLQSGQLRYAAMDVVLLPSMYELLRIQLERAGRWPWLLEEVGSMRAAAATDVDPDESWRRVRGHDRLDDNALRVLRALARWRERTARSRDRARAFVVSDAGLMELAKAKPDNAAALQAIGHIHPKAKSRYTQELLQVIADGRADTAPLHRLEALNAAQQRQLKRMRQVVQERAKALDIDPALLASRRELERLLRAVSTGDPVPKRFLGWRRAVVGDELLELTR
jgi:ribonuclease D